MKKRHIRPVIFVMLLFILALGYGVTRLWGFPDPFGTPCDCYNQGGRLIECRIFCGSWNNCNEDSTRIAYNPHCVSNGYCRSGLYIECKVGGDDFTYTDEWCPIDCPPQI